MSSATWTVLASGSSGNASLLEAGSSALLVDLGLGPKQIDLRLGSIGKGWSQIRAVVLTHTHADHWNASSIARLAESRVPFYCHPDHVRPMQLACRSFHKLQFANLVKTYSPQGQFTPIPGVRCHPVEVKHDGGITFGFRFENDGTHSTPWAIGYAADLGSWDARLASALAEVDILALEFNHDVTLQRNSGRAGWLINRVLGEFGHLSNDQAADLFEACSRLSSPGKLRHLVQLHLSRDCNRPALATAAARERISRLDVDVDVQTAEQHQPTRPIALAAENSPGTSPAMAAKTRSL
jgi:phosphoribosyl 1,2-cyclic phosphodiesterase